MLVSSTADVLPFLADNGKPVPYCREPVSMGCQLTWNISHNKHITFSPAWNQQQRYDENRRHGHGKSAVRDSRS